MANSQSDSNTFSVRIVSIDYYMAPPITDLDVCYSSFQGGKVNEVPVIRVYGSTPAGQKTCLHVHRALPYLYVPCSYISLQTPDEGKKYTGIISNAIEKALKLKAGAGSRRQHVHGCDLVRARKFYGYHSTEELFVKIYLYYPHEVTRVAALLLGGAILDRSFQPHESHIPYLLQFLVDYNLYGMGHLHVSKMKFRHPLPDCFIPRADHHSAQHRHLTEKLTLVSANSQAVRSSDAFLSSPIWISATIPSGWVWPFPIEYNGSLDQDFSLIKRQSTCELEGDAIVDDIQNQQLKLYSSLSQTRSDVKMVQSLIPIWEEEYERTGMREAVISCDPNKPPPEDVLNNLHEHEFGNALLDLCKEAESASSSQITPSQEAENFMQSIRTLTDVGNLVDFREYVNPNCPDGQSSKGLDEENINASISSGGSSKHHGDVTPSEQRPGVVELVPVDVGALTSEMNETSDAKVIDMEALGILRWLASSQGAEDLSTDDELVHEPILNPFLSTPTIGEVLEKANLEYESESQKECQDILDSVKLRTDYEDSKEQADRSTGDNRLPQIVSESMIPQVDGSDDHIIDHIGNSFEEKMINELERSPEKVPQDIVVGHSIERKRTKGLWGSLPFSTQQKVNDDLQRFNSTDIFNEMKNNTPSSSSPGNKVEKCSDVSNDSKEMRELTTTSVRDLMRRKRSYRVESLECGTAGVKKIFTGKKHKDDTSLCPKRLEFHMVQDDKDVTLTSSTTCLPEDRPDDIICIEACAESESFKMSDLSLLTTETKGRLEYLTMAKQDVLTSTGLCECNKVKTEHDFCSSCSKRATSDINSRKHDYFVVNPPVELVRVDEPSICKGLEQENAGSKCLEASLDKNSHGNCSTGKWLPATCFDSLENGKATAVDLLRRDNRVSEEDMLTHLSSSGGSLSTMSDDVRLERPVEIIFSKKVPNTDGTDGISNDVLFLPALNKCTNNVDMDNDEGTMDSNSCAPYLEGRDADEVLPFLVDNRQEEKEVYEKSSLNFHPETVPGVSIHYQNDGSFLYLLTTVFSPPSVESVNEWLSHKAPQNTTDDAAGTSGENLRSALLEPSSKPNFESKSSEPSRFLSGDMINLHGLLTDACHEILPESGSVSSVDPFLNPLRREDHDDLKTKITHCHTNDPHSKGNDVKDKINSEDWQDVSQISGPDTRSKLTPLSQTGFRDPASVGAGQQLTLLSIEIHAETRGDLRPDPQFDAINFIALVVQEDIEHALEAYVLLHASVGESCQRNLDAISGCKVVVVYEEKELFYRFMKIIKSFDPDILMGWEIQGGSLGYLAERAAHFGIGLLNKISRTPTFGNRTPAENSGTPDKVMSDNLLPEALNADTVILEDAIIDDEWGRTHASGVHVGGRIVLNIWRLMRGEIKLNMYTIEAVAEAVLRRKVPSIHSKILSQWFSSGPGRARFRSIEYVLERAKLNLDIMNQLDMINRTSELARVFGIDFFSVLSRGSQYRVESMLLRLAHTQNYLAISPGHKQVASQPAMECLPLVMEPESGFYGDPVVVLDFQSLYPSMIIAYNLCFCTCLGKVMPSKANAFGVSKFVPDPRLLMDLKNQILLTPNGVMYVPSKVRKGVLPRLLEEILSTRIMVKQAMKKLIPSQQVLYRIFNARQLALKLISNVTYGYTAAGFSGRMPCAELADSIVQCGRRTLETAISFVNAHDKWNARVIYGDTDSMFVLLKGRTVKEALRIGQEIASEITSMNPNPVVLKLEKVYHPCFLLTKKRYVGYSYESPDQVKPSFDAKGIETVRRDSCGAVAKTLEQSLRTFFEHQDISMVKVYLQRQWKRILGGRVSLEDFVFAKEVRLGTYSSRLSSLPPAAIVATKAMRADRRAEPRYAERIPYVVIHGEPGARLVDMVVDPLDLLRLDSPFRLNDLYYINKQIIPALQRVFGLVGVDLNKWFLEMPRPTRQTLGKRHSSVPNAQRTRIDYYYLSKHCLLCGELVQASTHFCDKCSNNGAAAVTAVIGRTSKLERDVQHLAAICRHCGGGDWIVESGVKCTSLACSVFYERRKVQKELQALSTVATETGLYPSCMVEWF